jgi:hypothetical protein
MSTTACVTTIFGMTRLLGGMPGESLAKMPTLSGVSEYAPPPRHEQGPLQGCTGKGDPGSVG